MRTFTFMLGLLLIAADSNSQDSAFRLASLFTDNMVLQQKSDVPVWGKGSPGTNIVLRSSWGKIASSRVAADSTWVTKLRTPGAGGPYTLTIRFNDASLTIRNVMVGEVWLCSGQSNMQMPVEGWPPTNILNSASEIKHASYPPIRLFSVKRTYSPLPEAFCSGSWEECSPATVPGFSATAYFFGRELYRNLKVPIGLIHSSWGGTPVESWTGAEYLSRVPSFDSTIKSIRVAVGEMALVHEWLRQFPVIDVSQRPRETRWKNLALNDDECMLPAFNDSLWHTMQLPTLWERTDVGEFDGIVWFRKAVAVPPAWLHKDLIIELGPIDDMDVTYVNGKKVGGYEAEGAWSVNRSYKMPKDLVDTTLLCIAVRVIDNGGGGGIYGDPKSMFLHPEGMDERVSLAGDWKFLPVADYEGEKLFVMGSKGELFFKRPRLTVNFSAYKPTSLYNGMIAPLVPYSLAGAIWYQGEANTNAPALYKTLFPLMIENWRAAFKSPALPLYFVQIAPFDYGAKTGSEFLREAQLASLAVKNTGMAVTLDIGNPTNIHPSNKQDVGRRLALCALAKTYKKSIEYSGPLYRSQKKFKDRIELTFDHAQNGLVLIGGQDGNGFQIAGSDHVFKQADVKVQENKLVISHPDITDPQAVRYAFGNTSPATLFNTAGLPSPSFRTDDWSH